MRKLFESPVFRLFVSQYFIIYTCSMLATPIYCSIMVPDAEFSLNYFWTIALFSLAADLPVFVYASKKDYSKGSEMVRDIFHFILLSAVLMVMGRFLEMYRNLLSGILFFALIVAVYFIVRLVSYYNHYYCAKSVNEKLAERMAAKQEAAEAEDEQ